MGKVGVRKVIHIENHKVDRVGFEEDYFDRADTQRQ